MEDQKKGPVVWTGDKQYVQQKDEYLRTGILQVFRRALKSILPSRGLRAKGTGRP